jgi:predicted nucleotidyltransferase
MIRPSKNEIYANVNKDIEWIRNRTLFLTIHGSHAYGLATPTSDIDVRGIAIPPAEYFLGFNKTFDNLIASDPYDMQIFNLVKFFALTSQGNPNTLELLFTEEEDHILVSDLGRILLDNRDKFLSRNLKERYIGYAKAQAHRIKNHKRWIDNPVMPPPTREEFGLSEKMSINKDQYLTVKALFDKQIDQWTCDFEPFSEPQKIYLQGKVSAILAEMSILSDNKWELAARNLGADENFIFLLQREKAYQNLVDDYSNYLTWKKHRNPERAKLEAKIGYDAKHSTQLIRLLLVGKEALLTGKLRVKRLEDREELMEIKNCHWPYQKVIDRADQIEAEVKAAYFQSPLPIKPNINALDDLCIRLVEQSLGANK